MALQAWIAFNALDFAAALNFAEASINVALTPLDRSSVNGARIAALVLLRRPEADAVLRDFMDQCTANDWRYFLTGAEGVWGVALVLRGEIGRGIRWLEQAILRREDEGLRGMADVYRWSLCEIYLEIISGTQKPPTQVLARNMLTLMRVMFTAEKRIPTLIDQIRQSPRYDPNGHYGARWAMGLGLLYKAKKKRALAVQHLTVAKPDRVSIWANTNVGADRSGARGIGKIAARLPRSNAFARSEGGVSKPSRLILPEAQAPQPDHSVHDGAPTIGGDIICQGSEGVQVA